MKKFKFLYIAAAALLFAACANEEDGIGNNGPVAATVQADISNNIKTRGTVDNNSWTAGDAIGVYASSSGNTTGDNKKYVTKNGDGTFEAADNNNIIYFKDNKETTFSAYYPYSESLTDGKMDWNMAAVEANQPCKADVLFASGATASKASPTVNFTDAEHRFKHCMSLVEFKIKPGQGVKYNNYKFDRFELKGIFTNGKFDTRTGSVETVGDRGSVWRDFDDVSFESEESFAYIMLPQSLESNKMDIEIYLLLNDSEVKYTTSITPSTNGQFEGGKKYTYNITVKNTGITIEKANIVPWENGDLGDLDAEIE
ncbi:fimbrillin family protein [Prevotella copri]|uniref:fimbrillin family protein n=1 Tax=Segatella copri TaxID=165179 RepID=UPI001C37F2D1|nr:fimbrillin family protein [Segatella copri]MBV3415353.1 fimbrillin family protein [Segatella copri]